MHRSRITADSVQTGQWIFVAGELYKVGAVNTYQNGTVGIQFMTIRRNEDLPAPLMIGNLNVPNNMWMEILETE